MAIAMVAMLAFGGTYAYFTATTSELASSGLRTGTVNIAVNEKTALTAVEDYAVPGSKIYDNETVAFTNTSTVDMYVYATLTVTLGSSKLYVANKETPDVTKAEDFASVVNATLDSTVANWAQVGTLSGVYGYKVEVGSNHTPATISSFVFDVEISSLVKELHTDGVFTSNNVYTFDEETDKYVALNSTIEGLEITVSVVFDAIQCEGTTDIIAAYDLV